MPVEDVKKQILLIDDNLSFLKSMRLALSKLGYSCQIAQSLETAQGMLREMSIDLIICDYFMPDIDGREALQQLGSQNQNCRLVLTSSYPLDVEFKKTDRFIFVDKLGLLEWLTQKYSELQYA